MSHSHSSRPAEIVVVADDWRSALKKAVNAAVTPEVWERAIASVARRAEEGDTKAIQFLMQVSAQIEQETPRLPEVRPARLAVAPEPEELEEDEKAAILHLLRHAKGGLSSGQLEARIGVSAAVISEWLRDRGGVTEEQGVFRLT